MNSTAAFFAAPFRAMAFIAELLLSRRGLGLAVLAAAALLVLGGWLRPPLTRDIDALHVPLGVLGSGAPAPEDVLAGAGPIPCDSAGAVLLALIAAAAVVVLLRPRALGAMCGLLLAAALAANAAIALNHPVLTELMEMQLEQRSDMSAFLAGQCEDALASATNGRVTARSANPSRQAEPQRGALYLHCGLFLLPLLAVGALFGTPGRLRRRIGSFALWTVVGVAAALALVAPRLRCEWHWQEARSSEQKGDLVRARAALVSSIVLCPQIGRLQRTWLLQGRLDFLEGQTTPYESFFRTYQLMMSGRWKAASDAARTLHDVAGAEPAARHLIGRLHARVGLARHRGGETAAACEFWLKAREVDPRRLDCRVYLGVAQASVDPSRPQQALAELEPLLGAIADRPVRADLLASLGDVHFDGGRLVEARAYYERSRRAYELPKTINYRARRGLGGL